MRASHTLSRPLRVRFQHLATAVALALLVALACKPAPPAPKPVPPGAPKLVLWIVADQVRADYLERFAPLLTGGLARLDEESVAFTNNHQAHAGTYTAAGYATLATGNYPSHHGVIANEWWDRVAREDVYAAYDAEHWRSPRNLLTPTLGDRMKETWPDAKVFAVGGKDRAANMTAGRQADAAYWYSRSDGRMVTSTYWPTATQDDQDETSTNWVEAFHARKLLDGLFGEPWEALRPLEELAPYGIAPLDFGFLNSRRSFPHALGGLSLIRDADFYDAIYNSPFIDGYVVDFAKALIDAEGLGADATPDFLGVTLSALDSVGHGYGPDSPELVDTLIRTDRSIGELLEYVDRRIGLDQTVVVFSSDHGVGRVPELVAAEGGDAGRFAAAETLCLQRLGRKLSERFGLGDSNWLPSLLYLDLDVLAKHQVDPQQLLAEMAAGLAECPRIDRVLTREELTRPADRISELFARSFYPERSEDLFLVLTPNTLTGGSLAASHGQPHAYDTHVPWLLRIPGVEPRRIGDESATVDVVATVAPLLGIDTTGVDGLDRSALFGTTGTTSPVESTP